MDGRSDWKRANKLVFSSSSGKNDRREVRDINDSPHRHYSNNYKPICSGNRIENSNNNSGYIDLNSAVDSTLGKKKRKRIINEPVIDNNASNIKPYQKIVLKKKDTKQRMSSNKKVKPVAPVYPDIIFGKPVRLNRFIANTGLCSRREADAHIKGGFIKVNGESVTQMGIKVNPSDEVCFKDKVLTNQRKIYLLLNKPKGFVTSLDDPNGKKLVIDLVRSACRERIYPVGRLDRMTTGVLLFTNDGDLSLKLTHPSNRMRKVYQVTLDKPISEEYMEILARGVELEDGPISFDSIAFADPEDKTVIGVEIHSGKNRIVRRMFESIGYKVVKLDRVYFAGLTRKGLKRGKWRFLSPEEVAFLKMMPS